jgi:seryl-tRNA synthetase
MDKIKKRLGLKADATEQDIDAAVEALQLKFAQASEAVAKVDELSTTNNNQAALLKELVEKQSNLISELQKALQLDSQATETEVLACVQKFALIVNEVDQRENHSLDKQIKLEQEIESLLNTIQELKEQPSNSDSNALVQRISEKEASEKAKALFHQYQDEEVCFITSDGQGFFREQYARNHTAYIKGADFFKFER